MLKYGTEDFSVYRNAASRMHCYKQIRCLALCLGFLPLLTACQDVFQDVLVSPQPQQSSGHSAIAQVSPTTVEVRDLREQGQDRGTKRRIGERTTLGDISMGYVWISTPPGRVLADEVRAELSAAGHHVTTQNPSVIIDGVVIAFDVHTDVNPLFWSVVGRISAVMNVMANAETITRDYKADCTERTMIWPTTEMITRVVSACVSDIGHQFASDWSVASALGTMNR